MVVVFTIHPCTPSARVFADLIRIPFTCHIINETHRIVKQELPIYSASPTYTGGIKSRLDVFCITGTLMVGTAGLPHVIIRFFTVRKVKDARISAG